MISTRKELKEFLSYEKKLYFKSSKDFFTAAILRNIYYLIYRFLVHLRKAEYHKTHASSIYHKLLMIFHLYLKNRLGLVLGFQITVGCFDKGLNIRHPGSVIVHSEARIGTDCFILGGVCIGCNGLGALPRIGNNVTIGWGATIIGDVQIADNICIGAGAVVTDSFLEPGIKIAGVPAKEL